ncbi:MAG: CRISPR-associated protein Cas4 [Desulfurococcaceae archaeon]|jgi:CRISPR-associated exonuclease Cas4|nr:MAG: CRISPR-associated protein Cas4 [Desulfurococcaceae archaeon]
MVGRILNSGFDVVSILYRVRREMREERKREPHIYWITDLVRCPLKREYEEIYPEISLSSLFSPSAIMGDLIHIGIEEIFRRELSNAVVLTEVEGSRRLSVPEKGDVEVRGRSDVIIEIGGARFGVEIKSARSDTKIPLEHHIDQVRLYNWLFNLNLTYLVYITHERITQYPIDQRATEEEVISRIMSKTYPRYQWECKYCDYAVLCPFKKTW